MFVPMPLPQLCSPRMGRCGRSKQGALLVEVVVATAVAVTVAAFISGAVALLVSARTTLIVDTQKLFRAEEGYELMRLLRDEQWSNIATLVPGTHYGLIVSTTTVAINGNPEVLPEGLVRTITIQPLYRTVAGTIVPVGTAGAAIDNNGRHLEVAVTDGQSTTTVRAVLTNLFSR